jgi:uncharacterized protein
LQMIDSLDALHAVYGTPGPASTLKVMPALTPAYRGYLERSRLCILSTVGPEGTDASPRGDDGPVVQIIDPQTLALPDWKGNERIDSLRNIVRDGRVSLMFLVHGSNTVIRVNGRARLTADADLCASFAKGGKVPRTVVLITIAEVYSQCARALIRSGLWSGENLSAGLPTVGDMLREIAQGGFDGAAYDADWPGRAARTMW